MEIRWGLIPDLGISVTSRGLIRQDHLRELAYTGRIVTGDEALELGLVTALHDDPLAAAHETAAGIAARSPDAIRGMKKMFNEHQDLEAAAALALEARLQAGILGQPNQVEAALATSAGRTPKFED